MSVIETTGIFEDSVHVRLAEPVAATGDRPVRILLLFEDGTNAPGPAPDFRAAIGSFYEDFPGSAPRSSSDWLQELREGE